MSSSTLSTKVPVRRRGRRRLTKRAAAVALAGVASMGVSGAIVASAAPPNFPDNLVVFPDRDFVTVEGYQDHLGETATLEIFRGGAVIGSAQGVVAEGDVAFEVNHPGGYCWGAGTNLNVTPDIKPGDVAKLRFGNAPAGDTTVQDAYVDHDATLSGSTVTVTGHVAPGVNHAQMEQRIVEPALVDTEVGKRDVRAVSGPLTVAPKGGYSSSLEFSGDTFTATYVFDSAATAKIAANPSLGERAMAWEVEDADANRQGLTIAEFGEPGGPGMGGCPAGPRDQTAPQPGTASVIRSSDGTSMQVNWEPTAPPPGAAAVTGYSVEAIAKTAAANGDHVQVGTRAAATAKKTTIMGLKGDEGYDVEVRSIAGPRMSEAFTVNADAPTPPPPGTVVTPTLTADPPPSDTGAKTASSVTLTSNGQIFYTTDGSPAILGDMPSDDAKLYTGPIPITAPGTELSVAAFDKAGNHTQLSGIYDPPATSTAKPDAPKGLTATPGERSVALKWTAPDPSVTMYAVQAYVRTTPNAPFTASGSVQETPSTTLTVANLTAGTEYWFTVKAKGAGDYGDESAKVGPVVPTADRITIGTAKWKSGDFRVTGTGSAFTTATEAVSVTVFAANADGTISTRSLGSAPVTAAAPPATGGDYSVRSRNAAAGTTNPGKIYVKSSKGGVAGPFTVANG
ncbi:MAG: hypothetical protein QOD81_4080 [Solirubrobacteraceae bacterium]|nr:hypothetical protein [Solirubrobacteraceae bacterium]